MNISTVKNKIDQEFNWLAVKYARRFYSQRDIKNGAYKRKTLSKEQKREIEEFWRPYCKLGKYDWQWFEFYNAITATPERLKYYIPESIYYPLIDAKLSNVRDCERLDDKNLYNLLFSDVRQPATVCRRENGLFLNNAYQLISRDEAKRLIRGEEEVIIKPSRNSCSGDGIQFINAKTTNQELESALERSSLVMQKIVRQHKDLSSLHPQSLNTIRIITFVNGGGKIVPLSSVIRIGTGGARVDNAHSGGIVRGIDSDGVLRPIAHNLYGKEFEVPSERVEIPSYRKCVDLVCRLAPRFVEFTRLVSWDLSVDESGEPVLIEVNLSYGGVDVHQLSNGPIFGDMTEEVLNEIFLISNG